MRYLSVCSGIEAATVAWQGLGWEAAGFADIDPFARALLAHHYPRVPLHGDFTRIKESDHGTIELLVGGTPCQSFSVAGLRKGLADERGNLALEFVRLAERACPRWLVWENVPGVLSVDRGRAFGSFLGALVQCGYGFAYRVLDAQYFGVPQRRRRVFVVGHSGDWRAAAAVLFERESLRGDIAPSRQEGKEAAGLSEGRASGGSRGAVDGLTGGGYTGPIANTLMARHNRRDPELETFVVSDAALHSYNIAPCDAKGRRKDPPGGGMDVNATGQTQTLTASNAHSLCIALESEDIAAKAGRRGSSKTSSTLGAQREASQAAALAQRTVRRLTPRECERLQGFPDDYTLIPYRGRMAADAPRYKALGNSMAVPVMRWLGERIAWIDKHPDQN